MAKPPPAEKPAPDAAPAPKTAWLGTRVGASFVAVVLMATVVGLLIWANGLNQRLGDEEATAIARETRFTHIDQRLATIEAKLDAAAEARRDRDEDAAASLDALDRRIAAIEARSPAATQEQADLGPLEDRLAAFEQAIETTRDAATEAGDAAEDLEDRIAALEARPAATEPPTAATLLAAAQLRAALRGSGPFETALAALETLGGDGVAAALAILAPHAATGIPTREMLGDRFAALAGEIMRAAAAPSGGSWISRTLARLSGLVTVRRIGGDVAGDSTEAIVARAEARLESGDLAAAVGEVAALEGAPAEVAASWLAEARARIQADDALAALDAQAIAAMDRG